MSVDQSATALVDLLKATKVGTFFERRKAVDDLARLPQSSDQVIASLLEAAQRDGDPSVRQAAIRAMETPIHQQFLRSRPALAGKLSEIKRRRNAEELAASQESEGSNSWWQGLNAILTVIG